MITIDEAIQTLRYPDLPSGLTLPSDFIEAILLGIEALKRIKEHRNKGYLRAHELLPGETKE